MCYFFFVFFFTLSRSSLTSLLFMHWKSRYFSLSSQVEWMFLYFPSSSYSIFWITHVLLVDPFKEFILFTFFLVVSSSTLLTTSYSPFIFFILFSSSLKPTTTTTTESFSKISLYLKSWVTWRYTIKWCCKKCVSKQKKRRPQLQKRRLWWWRYRE